MKGFTLTEVIIVIALLSIVGLIAASSFFNQQSYLRAKEASISLSNTIKLCQSEAKLRQAQVNCQIVINDQELSGSILVDDDENGSFETSLLNYRLGSLNQVAISNVEGTLEFDSLGRLIAGDNFMQLCSIPRGNQVSIFSISILPSGLIRFDETTSNTCVI